MEKKSERIRFRIKEEKKKYWKKTCSKRGISLTNLIIDSVENRLMNDERTAIMRFIEKQDAIFVKIETNINQIAQIMNAQEHTDDKLSNDSLDILQQIKRLKQEQDMIFIKMYSKLAKS